MDPSYGRADTIDLAYLEKGMVAEAQARLEKQRLNQNPWQVSLSIHVDARSGRVVDAHRSLERLQKMNRQRHIDPLIFAVAYIGLKDKDQALSFLEMAYAERSVSLTAVKVDPVYDFVRDEPRFQKVLRQMELTP
jgi:predicted Zn-dependent protease